jgi:hypothetical protein
MGRDDDAVEPTPREGFRPVDETRPSGAVPAGDIRVTPPRGDRVELPPGGETDVEKLRRDPGSIRADDTEPYIGLQYVARLFKIVALIVIVAIIAEVVAGLMYEGLGAGFNLFAEVIQGGVLAAMLWGAGDLTLLFIDVGHDVRAARVLLGRMSARMNADAGSMRTGVRREPRDGGRDGGRDGDLPPA